MKHCKSLVAPMTLMVVLLTAMALLVAGCSVSSDDKPTTFTVTYDANGAETGSAPAAQSKEQGTNLTLATNTGNLAKSNFTFAGWNTAANGNGTNYSVSAIYTADADLTLFAKWISNNGTFTISFDKNAEDATGSIIPQSFSATISQNLRPNTFIRSGYRFSGWNTEKDGSGTAISNCENYTAIASITLYAQWSIVNTTSYMTAHYLQNIDGSYPETAIDTERKAGISGEVTSAVARSYTGFTAQSFEQTTIAADASTIVRINYIRNDVTLTFLPEGGTFADNTTTAKTVTGKYGATITAPIVTIAGKKLAYWAPQLPAVFPANNTIYMAHWTSQKITTYTVEHFLQNTDGSTYKNDPSDTMTGPIGALTRAASRAYPGFTAQDIAQSAIASDGSTVIQVYYNRKHSTLTVNLDGGTITPSLTNGGLTGLYGTPVMLEKPVKTGYTFLGWSPSQPETFPATNTTITALWAANITTPYTVNHYKANLDGTFTDLLETQLCRGRTAFSIPYEPILYEGFTFDPSRTTINGSVQTAGTINADGSTVINLYYNRNTVTVTLDLTNGTFADGSKTTLTGVYGAPLSVPNPVKSGCTFSSWLPALPTTFPAIDTSYKASWTQNNISIIPITDDITMSCIVNDSDEYVYSVPTGYLSYAWFLDGEQIPSATTESYTIDPSLLPAGGHLLMVIVTSDTSAIYSAQYELQIAR